MASIRKKIKFILNQYGLFFLIREIYTLIVVGILPKLWSILLIKDRLTKDKNVLSIGILDNGGFGDALLILPLIKHLRLATKDNKCKIFFCTKYDDFFKDFQQIDEAVRISNISKTLGELYASCDVILMAGDTRHSHILTVKQFNKKRVKMFSETIYKYCVENIAFHEDMIRDSFNNYRIDQYGILLGKHRIEFYDMQGILGITRDDEINMPVFDDKETLSKFGVFDRKYILINRDAGGDSDRYPKLWLKEYYIILLKELKKEYPNMMLVLVGAKVDATLRPYVDIDLTGKTSLKELAVLLKNSKLLIAGEGGPVHLQHFLRGVSVVIFGCTDPDMLRYSENINICSDVCKRHCEELTDNWTINCPKGNLQAECMIAITPEMVMDEIRNLL